MSFPETKLKIRLVLKTLSKWILELLVLGWNNIEIIMIAGLTLLSPFIVDRATLPKGYELPKVTFLQIGSVLVTAIFLIKTILQSIKTQKIKLNLDILLPAVYIVLVLIATVLSPFQNIAIYGNQFRLQGAITHILMVIFIFIIYKKTTNRNVRLIFWAFFISSVFQSIESFGQFRYFLINDPKAILEGYYINGTFGQANFYSGRIMLGILSGIFLMSLGGNHEPNKRRLKKMISNVLYFVIIPILTLSLIVGLIISLSIWGIITSGLMLLTLIIYEIYRIFSNDRSKKHFGYAFGIILVLAIPLAIILLARFSSGEYNLRIDIWNTIINLGSHDSIVRILFGYGYDTLGEVFRRFGAFPSVYIDRAHNFFLDIYTQNGLIALLLICLTLLFSVFKFIFKKSNRVLTYLFIGTVFWLFRSFVHESGIVNLFDFLVLFGATLALQKEMQFKFSSVRQFFSL